MSDAMYGLAGGLMIGAAAALLLWVNGRVAGVSGILVRAFGARGQEAIWRWLWLAGLAGGGFIALGAGAAFEPRTGYPVALLLAAGVLVGLGTQLGNGCTSGHGICGVSRLSMRSLVATATFIGTGILTAWVVRHGVGVY